MISCKGYFMASSAPGEKAVKAAHESDLPVSALAVIDMQNGERASCCPPGLYACTRATATKVAHWNDEGRSNKKPSGPQIPRDF
jgi:hypothetical protein